MTTAQLSRLNRDALILYRHSRGDTITGIAKSLNLTRQYVGEIIRKSGEKVKESARMKARVVDGQ